MGYEDVRLITWLRNRFLDDQKKLAKVDAIVKEAADAGTMSAMDKARDKLLDLAKKSDSSEGAYETWRFPVNVDDKEKTCQVK